MKIRANLLIILVFIVTTSVASQEYPIRNKIDAITSQVSTARLKADIDKLVSFHNRNTFSDTLSDTRGIGAARRWLYGEFQKINRENGGRMKVYYDYFYQNLSSRLKRSMEADSVLMANVIAVIPGTRSDRILHINGHFDSRNESGMDLEGFAPGANDDGSGTIALLELARVLSKEKFFNTIMIFPDITPIGHVVGANTCLLIALILKLAKD